MTSSLHQSGVRLGFPLEPGYLFCTDDDAFTLQIEGPSGVKSTTILAGYQTQLTVMGDDGRRKLKRLA